MTARHDLVELAARKICGKRFLNGGVEGDDGWDDASPAMRDQYRDEARAVIAECWKEINSMIVGGELGGNGCDPSAQRNGLILAANSLAVK